MSFEDKQTVCSDCWITARDAERERIIKLLEDNLHDWTSGIHLLNLKVAGIDDLIALIKGENK